MSGSAPIKKDPWESPKGCWTFARDAGPVVATAIHAGHRVRPRVARWMMVNEPERTRREERQTAQLCAIAGNQIIVHLSRFEIDLDRPRDEAVYLDAEHAWGLAVWREPPPREVFCESLALYDLFYDQVHGFLEHVLQKQQRVVVLDLHSDADTPFGAVLDNEEQRPTLTITTHPARRAQWERLLHRFERDLKRFDRGDCGVEVRKEERYPGGHFASWINDGFGHAICTITIHVSEPSGAQPTDLSAAGSLLPIESALRSTIKGLTEEARST